MERQIEDDFLIEENQRLLAEIEKLNRNLQQYCDRIRLHGIRFPDT